MEIAMTDLIIQDELAERLRVIAQRENRPVEEVLAELLELYAVQSQDLQKEVRQSPADSLAAMEGVFDDDVTDLSTTVRETMGDYYSKKHASSD